MSAGLGPCASLSTTATEYSLAHPSIGLGRWSSGVGAELLEENVRAITDRRTATADRLFATQQYLQAFTIYHDACLADPEQVRFQFMAGISAWNAGLHDNAGIYLRQAVRLQPTDPGLQYWLADWCLDHGDYSGAMTHSAMALQLAPADPQSLICRASVLEAHGRVVEAWELTQRILQSGFRSPKLAALYSRLAPGRSHEHAALDEISELIRNGHLSVSDQRLLRLSAAALLDRIGRFDEAFALARAGHACASIQYDPNGIRQIVDQQVDYFTPAKLHDLPRASHDSRRPVFIIGMPRSGTSLIEQILASHPQVHGAGELQTLGSIVGRLGGFGAGADQYPRCLDELSMAGADRHASTYLRAIGALNKSTAFVTDKMPTNFLAIGLILTLFPDAHVIHCTRNPLDTCLSCYLTNFASGIEWARDLTHLGAYYRQYRRLMDHWTRTLNFPMLEVRYEDVVADQLGQTRRLLEFLGLPWDDRCAAFHKTPRHVTTASGNQVNQPIYSRSVNRWRNYERHLAALRAALGDCAN